MPDRNNLEDREIYFGSWFHRLQSILTWSHVNRQNTIVPEPCVGGQVLIHEMPGTIALQDPWAEYKLQKALVT